MKPLNRKNYGSIPHLSNSKLGEKDYYIGEGQERILTIQPRDKYDTIIVTEKYDGSNVGVCKVDGNVYALTRSGYEARTSPYKQHHLFADWVNNNLVGMSLLLKDGERICGEWMAQAHGLRYEINQEHPIVFFDWYGSDNKRKPFSELEKTRLPLVRKLHEGSSVTTDSLIHQLNAKTDTVKAIGKPEGMVYRIERNGTVDFLAKWVRSDFPTGKYIIEVEEDDLTWNINPNGFAKTNARGAFSN